MTLSQFQIKASSLLARLRLLNILVVCLRHLTPRRLDAIFDLKPVLPALSFAILCCTLLIPALVQSADIPRISPKAVITAVTVYQDRAMTTRQVTVNLPAGSHLVVFEGLPSIIQDDSVRVSGKGTAGATIAGMEIRRSFLETNGEKRAKELNDEIRALERKVASLDARKSGLDAQRAFFDSIRVAWGDRISKDLSVGKTSTAELMDISGFVGTGVTKVEEQGRDLEAEKRILTDKIDALKKRRDAATGSNKKEVKSVEVELDVAKAGALTLELSSVTFQAGWEPGYDLRLNSDMKTAQLVFRSLVHQKTGEDWNSVELNLSTARPALGGTPPEMNPWTVALLRPMQLGGMPMVAAPAPLRAKKAARPYREMMMETMADAEEDSAPVPQAVAAVTDEQGTVSFRIPRPIDIPSDGSKHGAVVAMEELPVTPQFLAVPKLSPYVYLTSELINRAAYPLLPGKVALFSGSTYTGSAHLKKVAVGEAFTLSFGVDDTVSVKREALKQHEEAGMFGKNRMSYRYKIEIANLKKEERTLILRDQLPLVGDSEIKVTLDEPNIKPDETKNDGTLVWKLPLKGEEKREITFGITVEYPKDRQISGLN